MKLAVAMPARGNARAGRELDKVVARTVLGYRLVAREGDATGGITDGILAPRPVPPYSTDLTYAMEIVFRLRRKGVEVTPDFGRSKAFCRIRAGRARPILRWGLTQPEAICRAALAFVKSHVPGRKSQVRAGATRPFVRR